MLGMLHDKDVKKMSNAVGVGGQDVFSQSKINGDIFMWPKTSTMLFLEYHLMLHGQTGPTLDHKAGG